MTAITLNAMRRTAVGAVEPKSLFERISERLDAVARRRIQQKVPSSALRRAQREISGYRRQMSRHAGR